MIRFDAARAQDLVATFELRVRFARGRRAVPFTLEVDHGKWRVRPGAATSPGASATISARDLIALTSGSVSWLKLFSAGRLELSGDPFLALRLPTLFRL